MTIRAPCDLVNVRASIARALLEHRTDIGRESCLENYGIEQLPCGLRPGSVRASGWRRFIIFFPIPPYRLISKYRAYQLGAGLNMYDIGISHR